MTNIKKYWKEILLVLLLIFSLNKCTQSCSRSTVINTQQIEIAQKDSIIKQLREDSTISAIRFNDAQASNETYRGIATGNQKELIEKIEYLTNANKSLHTENEKLRNEIKKLKENE